MKRLLKRNGFTTVELIVVVAVMAVLLVVVIPLLSSGNARETEAKEYARSFYSNVQELMVDEKLAKTAFPAGANYLLVCAEVEEQDVDFDDITIYMSHAASSTSFGTLTKLVDTSPNVDADGDGVDDKFELTGTTYDGFGEFVTSLRKMLLTNDKYGCFFAVVDNKYRVVSAYFAFTGNDSDTADTIFGKVKGGTFTADARLGSDNILVGSWPEELCEKGKTMFQMP